MSLNADFKEFSAVFITIIEFELATQSEVSPPRVRFEPPTDGPVRAEAFPAVPIIPLFGAETQEQTFHTVVAENEVVEIRRLTYPACVEPSR